MADPVYRKLQAQLDQYSMGFPVSKSGIEIKILEKLFSKEDAHIFLQLTPQLETPDAIAPRINMTLKEATSALARMASSGLLFSLKKNDTVRYGAIPFVHGLFEFQVNGMDKELAALVRQYMDEEFKHALQSSAANFLRVIPINQSVQADHKIAAYEDALEILKNMDPIVVTDCMCRKSSSMIDDACGKPLETCFMFGSMAKYYLDHDMGRQIDFQEAEKIMTMSHEQGLVTQPATSQNPSGMCNCCGDCCGPLTSLKSHDKPAELVFSNYFINIDDSLCTSCETCIERCQMDAIVLNDNDLAQVNLDRCIGCGLCVTTCPTQAICLEKKPEKEYTIPPKTTLEQMMNMAKDRGVI